ncbi:uncharacterized protein LODBEIA_P02030 [Lodderomyces beijingensis]|uniref:Pre-mRNA-splicing factor CWC2 n=1 Tax=Lodderomyces beijingensis TaxID=1775926 RepID=A0ABP0ZCS0_9ASCO
MSRPARLQVDIDSVQDYEKPQQVGGQTFNIWYLKWSGGNSSASNSFVRSKFRVSIDGDEGYTRARKNSPICLFFSRGCCYQGSNCKFCHCLPSKSEYNNRAKDCFGRDKTAEYDDDMDGVGSLKRQNCTLYVGGLQTRPNLEQLLKSNFEEFGQVEKVKVVYSKSCAFVTMKLESAAQFAKEAMDRQSLVSGNTTKTSKEVLHIRWAHQDRNSDADQVVDKRKLEDLAKDAVRSMLKSNTTKRIKISEEPNGGRGSPTEVVQVEELDDDDDESDDEGGEEEEEELEEGEGQLAADQQTSDESSINNFKNGTSAANGFQQHNRHTDNSNNNSDNNYSYANGNSYAHQNGSVSQNGHVKEMDSDAPHLRAGHHPHPSNGNGNGNGYGIFKTSSLQDLARIKKKLIFKRNEPCLVSVLANYSSDEDDD